MQLYNIFYRTRGIRRVNQIVSPPLSFVKDWEIPRASVLHYLTDNVATGPDANYPYLKGAERGAWIDHLTSLMSTEGNPRYLPSGAMHEIREYNAHNPLMRWMRHRAYTTLTDARYPLVVNYDLLPKLYVYRTNIWARWYEWQNRYVTLCNHITKASEIERQQFWVIELPAEIPSIVKFQHADAKHDTTTARMFNNDTLITLLDLWKWVGENRENSILSTVPTLALEKLNIVFTRNGQFTVMNLGLLNSWRESDEDDEPSVAMESLFAEINDDVSLEDGHTGVQLDPLKLQKRLLRLWLTLGDANVDADIIGDDEFVELNAAGLTPRKQTTDDVDSDADAKFRDPVETDPDDETEVNTDDTEHQGGKLAIDEDDAQTDTLLQTHSETTSEAPVGVVDLEAVAPYQAPLYTPEANVIRKAKEALAQGSISLAEYQRLQMLSERYQTIEAPGTDTPLSEFVKIPSTTLAIPKDVTLAPTAGLVDATMNQSSLTVFDTQYIDQVLDRDVLGMIVGFQQSGVALTKLHAEDFQNISNHYRIYTIELTPVTGKQSTLKVKVPVVQADGTVLSGGVRYYLKKQRSELPIRKTSPTRVALTSYYGKTFIDRAESVVVNYDHWLSNQITMLGLSRDASTVTEMRVGEVFDSTARTPRVYSLLGKRFTSFTAAGIPLSFNYNRRVELYGDQSKLERQFEGVVVGRHDGMVVLMRQDNSLVKSDGTHTTELGTIETLLGLSASKRPVEMATMSIFSESIPLGIVLGYKLGFSTLLRTLGVKPRRVENGRQLNMTDNEYRIRFKDCSLIFDRTDVKATLVISGLNARHRSVVKYDLAQFDKPDVYLNIIEDYGLTIRYTREIDNLYDMFIDPITRELLLDMKEPTDMVLLILRGAELLTTDYHNEEEGTRYKGYERIAGTVYKQLMLAYRQKQTRPFSNRLGIEMNPEAVWMACMMDTSMEVSDDINPIHNLKQKEIVTFGGTGGRSAKTMVKRTRQYRNNDVGVISEATVDSDDVGVITYLSADPKFNSIRGTFDPYDFATEGKTRLLSTSALLAPSAENDD